MRACQRIKGGAAPEASGEKERGVEHKEGGDGEGALQGDVGAAGGIAEEEVDLNDEGKDGREVEGDGEGDGEAFVGERGCVRGEG